MNLSHIGGGSVAQQRGGVLQEVKILTWNVRGAGNRHFLNEFKEHVRIHSPHVLALLETHISGDRADDTCRRSGFDTWHCMEAQGYQGGTWLL